MFIVIVILHLVCSCSLSANSLQDLLSAAHIVSNLIYGFREHPLIVWTSKNEMFPELAANLIEESLNEFHPYELWQEPQGLWRPHFKIAPGKPLYAIFPPADVANGKNVLLKMLRNFTDYTAEQEYVNVVTEHIYASVFLFLSNTHDGSQEDPSFMQIHDDRYGLTPPQLLFLKYEYSNEQSVCIRLESLRAVRMRCERTERYSCMELISKGDPRKILSYLSSENIRNLIQTEWRIAHATNVFMPPWHNSNNKNEFAVSWESLQEFLSNHRFRDWMKFHLDVQAALPFVELVTNVNVTITFVDLQDSNIVYFVYFVVGYIIPDLVLRSYHHGLGLSLHGSVYHTIIYGADVSSWYNPFTAKSLFGACGTLELFILLALFSIVTALRLRKYRFRDFFKVVISTLAPLISQSCQFKRTRFNILYYIWMVSTWFSTLMYLSLLQSQRVAPEVQVGNETLKDLEDRQMSFYASLRTYQYIAQYRTSSPHETLSRLSKVLQCLPMWEMPEDEFRSFFELSESAWLVEALEVETMSKVLTKAYSKSYFVIPEKIDPQLEWTQIFIPQGEYVIESFKRMKDNGIWDYWYQNYHRERNLDFEKGLKNQLYGEDIEEDDSDNFEPLNISDSVLLEITTLCGLILNGLVTVRFGPIAWLTLKTYITVNVSSLRD